LLRFVRLLQLQAHNHLSNAGGVILLCSAALLTSACNRSENAGGASGSTESTATTVAASFEFQDRTSAVQLAHRFENGEDAKELSILETIGGGVAALDYDRDGFDDLCLTSGGLLNNKTVTGLGAELYRNLGGGRLDKVTNPSQALCSGFYTHAAVSSDLNNDGFADLLITGYYGLTLLINQGDGTFSETTQAAGMSNPQWSTSAAPGDFDNDGNQDLYIAHYVNWSFENHPACKSANKPDVCTPGIFTGISDVVYMNNGDGTFTAKTKEIGLATEGKGLGVIVNDFTQDNLVDVYVANDTTNNFFFENQGGRFNEIGLATGLAIDDMGTPQGSMGLCTLDFDADLLPDIMVSNYENQSFALYKNDGETNFRYSTASAGLMALGTTYVAWGSSANDFDLDGDQDVVIADGHVMRSTPPEQLPLFLNNLGNSKFQSHQFAEDSYFRQKWRGRGVVAFDFEHDGDLDLLFTHINQNAALLANTSKTSGDWWVLELVGTRSNRDAVGTRIVIHSKSRKILRNVVGGGSYLSQGPYYVHWGLPGGESAEVVEITWPSGQKQQLNMLASNQRHLVIEPAQ
jgi:enediyne biosynthesis protein E4